ncbi:MAG: NADPH-dependent glutamate synthase [Deltaproteobacteria bacterium]|nr:NADPH-dependent glutamate synthase [Deltaproteobacteria bacterium]MBW1933948.1 NADPH-dependent glutamate synthase [Deltaproteobacteria bacterium]MBW1977003.1 NADPH-dependent glutamate synthase [Deltaproteobacteria bacterium]MBW2299176.1 NADPH-dependent glutamate synthase [Deltaproteobacteria bacterium]
MDPKERKKIPRQKMPEQDPRRRRHNFEEVPYGFTEELALTEAKRCLKCKKPLCMTGCPVNIRIPEFIKLIEEGKFIEAAWKLKEQNSLPAVTGRVCPQESQCESKCILGKKGEPVAIGRLERFAADFERSAGKIKLPDISKPTGKKVAVIGAGPAGLTVAGDLIKLGHQVTIFEALHEPGGVLVYGIPEFRLPKEIVRFEVDYLRKLGVEIKTDYVVGKANTVDELLRNGFDAVFIGTGAGLPIFMNIPGENLVGVYSANEYLTRSNLMKAFRFPEYGTAPIRSKKVITIGGGNVAMDSARTALRLGAESIIVYRRSRAEMPARAEEIHHAEEEGVQIKILTNPVRIIGDEKGKVKSIECIKMKLGEPDASGRRRPIPIKGSEFIIDCDTVVPALGNRPNPLIPMTTPDLKTTRWGTLECDPDTLETSKKGVFAGGDIVTGAATVISAMGAGKVAAKSIHEYLTTGKVTKPEKQTPKGEK